jgi:hypothetical protein
MEIITEFYIFFLAVFQNKENSIEYTNFVPACRQAGFVAFLVNI